MKTLVALLLCLASAAALALENGERLAPWTLLDQFDQPYTLDDQVRILLVARDMEAAKLVNGALSAQPKGYLEARHGVFLADVSRMPKIIASLFALPAMRDYPYRVLLDRDARIAPRYPAEASTVLWLELREGHVSAQKSFTSAAALEEALGAAGS